MTMRLPIYQVDAFTSRVFGGNPAAIVPLETWLPAETMLAIAAENNLSETAFFVAEGEGYGLRWFTPTVEMDLCGHATLASAHLIFDKLKPGLQAVRFSTRSGVLEVKKAGDLLSMDFPSRPPEKLAPSAAVSEALGKAPVELWGARDYLAVYASADDVLNLKPHAEKTAALDRHAVIATAPGKDCDFVSRFFAPALGVYEDPVTGSAHCTLIPYWAKRLGKAKLSARQVSSRGGELTCEDRVNRVTIAGKAALYLEGSIQV
jgi:predicted PhzF superfamily epimerase YddE/YHI9